MQTIFNQLINVQYPIIAGPMFLVSNEALVIAAARAGILGGFPTLNWMTPELLQKAIQHIKKEIPGLPFAANLIVHQTNKRMDADLEVCIEEKVPFFITSLGNPKKVIERAHRIGAKVFCDVTTLTYAKKVEDLGADGVIAVSSGAGGHAGPISPLVLLPYLKRNLKIPIIAAGGITTGEQILACFVLGAAGVQMGTRFLASKECNVPADYKNAILKALPEDIVLTSRLTGTPASVIRTPAIEKAGLELKPIERYLLKHPHLRKWFKQWMKRNPAQYQTWKGVWSAGQGVGLIKEVVSLQEIVQSLVIEFDKAKTKLQ